MKRALAAILAFAILVVVVAAIAIYSGLVPVDARRSDPRWVRGLLATIRDRSVERGAEGIRVPPLGDTALVRRGMGHYVEMCEGCHGAPGIERSEIGRGLNPRPPELYRHPMDDDEEVAEAFWVVKNGIRMTGMPAFGPTHDDETIWAMVAVLKALPEMSAEDYARQAAALPPGADSP